MGRGGGGCGPLRCRWKVLHKLWLESLSPDRPGLPTNSSLHCMCDRAALNHNFRVGAIFHPELAEEGAEPLGRVDLAPGDPGHLT